MARRATPHVDRNLVAASARGRVRSRLLVVAVLPVLLAAVAWAVGRLFSASGSTWLLTASAGATTALSLALVVPGLRWLRRLEHHALDLAEGNLDTPNLGPFGPTDLAPVSVALDHLASNLRLVVAQADATVDGDLDSRVLRAVGPGALGSSVRSAIRPWLDLTAQLATGSSLANAIVDTAGEAIWTLDQFGAIRTANQAAESMVGYTVDEQTGRLFTSFVIDDVTRHEKLRQALASGVRVDTELVLRRRDGEHLPVLVSSRRVAVEDGWIVTVFAREISERKLLEERLARQARHDSLTGLLNRAAVLERLDTGLVRARRSRSIIAVLFVDLDDFKHVNDTFGHAFGDELLAQVGERLRAAARAGDTVARLGGDEFLLLAEGVVGPLEAVMFAERLIADLAVPYVVRDTPTSISASVGVALSGTGPDQDALALQLLHDADVAVYRAKAQGRNRVVLFDEELQRWVEERSRIERDLQKAIPDGELLLHYQPIIEVATGEMWGAEALVRWNRPGVGMVPPGVFIPVAEQSRLVIDVGRWVIAEACSEIARWAARGERLRVAVNLSGRHLIEGDLRRDVGDALTASGIDPSCLELEITETHLLQELDATARMLEQLRELGVGLSIDDFGTGYSSITYLRTFPADTMKIDRSFVDELEADTAESSLAKILVSLAHTMDLKVVAEGVETEEQLRLLRVLGCDYAQGFHLARPMPAGALEQWASREAASGDQAVGSKAG